MSPAEFFDSPGLLVAGGFAALVIGIIVLVLTARRGFAELWTWNLANCLVLASLALSLLRAALPPRPYQALQGGLALSGLACYAAAAFTLHPVRDSMQRWLWRGTAALVSLCALAAFLAPFLPQSLPLSSSAALLCLLACLGIPISGGKTPRKGGASTLFALFALGVALWALDAGLSLLDLPRTGGPATARHFMGLDSLAILILAMPLNFALLLSLMSRLEREIVGKVLELGESKNELQVLYDAFTETAGSVDLDDLIPRILDLLRQRLSVDMAALYLWDPRGKALSLVAQRGLDTEAISVLMGPQQDTSTAWRSFSEKRAEVRRVVDYPEGAIKQALVQLELGIIGGFPIASRGEPLGCLTIGYREEAKLDELKVSLLETLTLQLGSVVKAASLHDQLNRANTRLDALASTDALTGLANRRSALRALEAERSRAQRQGGLVAILMCDIDHFKAFNDEHGHECGDLVLVNTASVIMNSLRATDLAARWGGEEFLVVLGSAKDAQGPLASAQRILGLVRAAVCEYGGRSLSVTLTIGLSLCPVDTQIETAIALADKALYRGKAEGRDRVAVLFGEGLPDTFRIQAAKAQSAQAPAEEGIEDFQSAED